MEAIWNESNPDVSKLQLNFLKVFKFGMKHCTRLLYVCADQMDNAKQGFLTDMKKTFPPCFSLKVPLILKDAQSSSTRLISNDKNVF